MNDPLDLLAAAELLLAAPGATLRLEGGWMRRSRLAYSSHAQDGSGAGPYVEVEDVTWEGVVIADTPVAGLVMLAGADGGWAWAKSARPVLRPELRLTFSDCAPPTPHRWFKAVFHDAFLPDVPLAIGDPPSACSVAPSVTLGRARTIVTAGGVSVALLLLPATALRVGRCGLWRVRDEALGASPDGVRTLLTRGRRGGLRE